MKGNDLFSKITAYFTSNIFTNYLQVIRPHLDYGDAVYDQSSKDAFSNKLKLFNKMQL